jgi:hypothetical protein
MSGPAISVPCRKAGGDLLNGPKTTSARLVSRMVRPNVTMMAYSSLRSTLSVYIGASTSRSNMTPKTKSATIATTTPTIGGTPSSVIA